MTLTNNIRDIQDLAGHVIELVDLKDYPNAHLLLDELEKKVRAIRRHIDHLQNVTDFAARPPGPSEKFRNGVIENEYRESARHAGEDTS